MLTAFLFALTLAAPPQPAACPPVLALVLKEPVRPLMLQEDDAEVEDKREAVKLLLGQLKGHVGKRGEQDTEAVGVIDSLLQEFKVSGPKDRASIAKGLGKCFDAKRRELESGLPNNKLYVACAVCLGEMGKDATKVLQKYVGNKKHRSNIALQRALILSLGKTKDVAAVKSLLDLLKSSQNTILSSAAEALAQFSEAPLKVRKDIFNEALKLLVTTKAQIDQNINDITSRERYDAIGTQLINTLQDLSGQTPKDAEGGVDNKPEAWQRWWNKNKKKDWDEEED